MRIIKSIAAASCLVLLAGGVAFAQTVAQSALFGTVLEYPTSGCDGAVVQTPLPGKQFASPSLATPAWVASFYAQAAARHVTWLTSMQCTHTGRTHALVPLPEGEATAAITNGYVNQNWSGYQIGNTAQYTQAGWTIPTVIKPNPGYSGTGYYSSTWTGIGGGINANPPKVILPLIQSGSTQNFDSSGTASYYFWYEIAGGPTDTGGELKILSGSCTNCLTAHPSDVAGSVVIWTPNAGTPTQGTVQLGVCDFTDNNKCVNFVITQNPITHKFTPQPGNSTEWIVEAPANSDYAIQPLADFGSVTFVGNCWSSDYANGTGTCYPISQGMYPDSLDLQRTVFGIPQIIASPTALNADGSFTDYYYQPQRGD